MKNFKLFALFALLLAGACHQAEQEFDAATRAAKTWEVEKRLDSLKDLDPSPRVAARAARVGRETAVFSFGQARVWVGSPALDVTGKVTDTLNRVAEHPAVDFLAEEATELGTAARDRGAELRATELGEKVAETEPIHYFTAVDPVPTPEANASFRTRRSHRRAEEARRHMSREAKILQQQDWPTPVPTSPPPRPTPTPTAADSPESAQPEPGSESVIQRIEEERALLIDSLDKIREEMKRFDRNPLRSMFRGDNAAGRVAEALSQTSQAVEGYNLPSGIDPATAWNSFLEEQIQAIKRVDLEVEND